MGDQTETCNLTCQFSLIGCSPSGIEQQSLSRALWVQNQEGRGCHCRHADIEGGQRVLQKSHHRRFQILQQNKLLQEDGGHDLHPDMEVIQVSKRQKIN